MFGLTINRSESVFLTIGRTVPFPLYYMRRSGGPVLRHCEWGKPRKWSKTPEFGQAGKDRDIPSIREGMANG